MAADKEFCMSSYLAFRFVVDPGKQFKEGIVHKEHELTPPSMKKPCHTADDMDRNIRDMLQRGGMDLNTCGVLLSGGIDSAILASYMPAGTKAYTARCIGENAVDETEQAKRYCDEYGLEHVIVDVSWDDYKDSMDELMLFQGCPIISNEPQAYKIAKQAGKDGIKTLIHGDTADTEFGGMSHMMSRDWTLDEWIDRSIYIRPETVMKEPANIYDVYEKYRLKDDMADNEGFIKEIYSVATAGALTLACRCAGLGFLDPYEGLRLAEPLDMQRVRNGDSKYLVRELFRKRYPDIEVSEKKPMSRPAEAWMRDWEGPHREEFIPGCEKDMSGEQRLLLYSLERFLDLIGA